jgi:hypothetical protein
MTQEYQHLVPHLEELANRIDLPVLPLVGLFEHALKVV